MAAFINTNTASLNAQRNLTTSQSSLTTSLQRLSSGLRINSAKDDAAGLAISERFTTQIRGISQAARNANDGISLAQTAEGTLGEIGNNLQRMRELAVQSRNSTNSAEDRVALDTEVQQLKSEIGRVAGQANFNGTKLLDGSATNMTFQVGANQGETISIANIANANTDKLGDWTSPVAPAVIAGSAAPTGGATAATPTVTAASGTYTAYAATSAGKAFALTVGGITVASKTSVGTSDSVTAAQLQTQATTAAAATGAGSLAAAGISFSGDFTTGTAKFTKADGTSLAVAVTTDFETAGSFGTGFVGTTAAGGAASPASFTALTAGQFKINNIDVTVNSAANASARVDDLVAAINGNASIGVTASKDATTGALSLTSSASIVIGGSGAVTAQTGMTAATTPVVAAAAQKGFANGDVTTAANADKMILAMDAALKSVNSARAGLGAVQNRFSSVIANLQTTSENLSASRSRIQDTDFAAETASLTRGQILQQAGTAMLAQANSLPNGVLSLLRG